MDSLCCSRSLLLWLFICCCLLKGSSSSTFHMTSYNPDDIDICHGIFQTYLSYPSRIEQEVSLEDVSASDMCSGLQPQYNALFTLYSNTAGSRWRWKNSGGLPWCFTTAQCADYLSKEEYANPQVSSTPNPCLQHWQGIECDRNNCSVVSLSLHANQLIGTLPDMWQSLSNLTKLEITDNPCILRGPIPDSIYDLHNLKSLSLRNNLLSGVISSKISALYNLQHLNLRRNVLVGSIPADIAALTKLETLVLMGNALVNYIPESLGQLNKLTELDLSFNFLSGPLPVLFDNITTLRSLFLNNNSFTGSIPSYSLEHLETLQLYSNYLSRSIPSSLYRMSRLTLVDFRSNMLTGSISEDIANLTLLATFNVNGNQLDGIFPHTLWNVSSLRILDLGNNFFFGALPTVTGNLSYLYDLRLQQNLFSSTLPDNFGTFHNLSRLDLSTNFFNSPLPTSFSALTKMADLDFGDNMLDSEFPHLFLNMSRLHTLKLGTNYLFGDIPANISRIKDLVYLDVSYNLLRGHIPSTWGHLHYLETLILADNQFSGSIATILQRNFALVHADFSQNKFTGSLPVFFNPIMTYYDMSHNAFEGSIPSSLSDCRALRYFAVQNNAIMGTFPAELGELPALYRISVDDNLMTGTLPSSLSNLKFLSTFKVHSNLFHGLLIHNLTCLKTLEEFDTGLNFFEDSIPAVLGNAFRLATLQVDVGFLTGTIPASIFQLQSLQIGYFSRNLFTGELLPANEPAWSLPKITELKLDANVFSGSLPDVFQNTTALYLLNVSFNALHGSLPPSLRQVVKFETLSLSDNAFSGSIGDMLQNFTALQTLFLNDNKFVGSLGDMFDGDRLPVQLNLVDVSGNRFSGTLPEVVFNLPNISTFAAVRNCFTGALPDNVCNPKDTLITLALDGLHASTSCNVAINFFGKSYSLANHLEGSVPTCLFEDMTVLQTLHLAGNDIGGYWLSALTYINPALQDLSLSHNNLRGNIPNCIQHRVWDNLDLSFNKLSGDLSDMDVSNIPANASLYLQLNRLSGAIPAEILQIGNISLITGNIFECPAGTASLPSHDADQVAYVCASDNVENPSYAWLGMTAAMLSTVAVLFYFRKEACLGAISRLLVNCERYWTALNGEDNQHIAHLTDFARLAKEFRWLCVRLAAILAVVVMPINGGFHLKYSTYENVYGWALSGCYLSGVPPAAVGIVLYILLLVALYSYFFVDVSINTKGMQRKFFIDKSYQKTSIYNLSNTDNTAPGAVVVLDARTNSAVDPTTNLAVEVTWKDYAKWYLAMAMVVVLNCAVMLSINVLFVDSVSNAYSAHVKQLIAIPMSLFKIIWKNVIMNTFEESLLVLRPKVLDVQERIDMNKWLVTMFLWMALFNSIIAPCVSAAIASPECFKYLFVHSPSITTSFTVAECSGQKYIRVIMGNNYFVCGDETQTTYSTTFVPPYSYSYQCSASLLSSFVPVFIFRFIFSGCLFPLVHICTKVAQDAAYHKFGKDSKIFIFINDCLRTVFRPLEDETDVEYLKGWVATGGFNYFLFPNRKFSLLNFRKQVITFVTDLGILLTFGLIWPPLGIIAAISICVYSSFTQLILGRVVCLSATNAALLPSIVELNRVANGAPSFFFEAIRSLSMLLVLFWSMFLLDIIGDVQGLAHSTWILAVLGSVPSIIYLSNRLWKKKYLKARNEADLKKAQALHRTQQSDAEDVSSGIEMPKAAPAPIEEEEEGSGIVDVENPLHGTGESEVTTSGVDGVESAEEQPAEESAGSSNDA